MVSNGGIGLSYSYSVYSKPVRTLQTVEHSSMAACAGPPEREHRPAQHQHTSRE